MRRFNHRFPTPTRQGTRWGIHRFIGEPPVDGCPFLKMLPTTNGVYEVYPKEELLLFAIFGRQVSTTNAVQPTVTSNVGTLERIGQEANRAIGGIFASVYLIRGCTPNQPLTLTLTGASQTVEGSSSIAAFSISGDYTTPLQDLFVTGNVMLSSGLLSSSVSGVSWISGDSTENVEGFSFFVLSSRTRGRLIPAYGTSIFDVLEYCDAGYEDQVSLSPDVQTGEVYKMISFTQLANAAPEQRRVGWRWNTVPGQKFVDTRMMLDFRVKGNRAITAVHWPG